MVKTTKIYLCMDSKDTYKLLWKLQDNTRMLKNKAVQMLWEWNNFSQEYKKEHEEYPKPKDILNYTVGGYMYDKLKSESLLASSNLSSTLQLVEKQFKTNAKDFLRGDKSIICFKKNQPLDIHNKSIRLSHENGKFYADIVLMNKATANEHNGGGCALPFRLWIKDKSTRTIVERCYDGVYSVSGSKIKYDEKKKMWYINLSYGFDKYSTAELDKEQVLGVYLAQETPFTASVIGDHDRLQVSVNEIEHYRNAVESRRRSILRQSAICGEGRIGHGYKKRVEPMEKLSHKVADTRDTINHKYSKAIVEYAVKKGCGTIRMEKLTGISETDRYLRNWSYFDLQTKIEYKAKERGIDIVYVDSADIQRCCRCGHVNEEETAGSRFKCTECGFEHDVAYNASQNLSAGGKDIKVNGRK